MQHSRNRFLQREVWVHVIKREILSQQLNLGAKFHEQQSWQQNSHNIRNFASTGVLWFKIGHVVKNFLFKNLHWVKYKKNSPSFRYSWTSFIAVISFHLGVTTSKSTKYEKILGHSILSNFSLDLVEAIEDVQLYSVARHDDLAKFLHKKVQVLVSACLWHL